MSLLHSTCNERHGVRYSPVMMARAAQAARSAASAAKNSPVVKGANKMGRQVAEGVVEEFAKREAKDIAKDSWQKGRQILKKSPDRSKASKTVRRPRFFEEKQTNIIKKKDNTPKPNRLAKRFDKLLESAKKKEKLLL